MFLVTLKLRDLSFLKLNRKESGPKKRRSKSALKWSDKNYPICSINILGFCIL